jgi:hypothetical protein
MTRKNGPRAWAAVTMTTALLLASSTVAMADVPQSTPNSGVSHNCVTLTSGKLYSEKYDIPLGWTVSKVAPGGGQRDYVQGALKRKEPCWQ